MAAGPTPSPLVFPDERPLDQAELEALDCRRLQPVIETLDAGLRSYWLASGAGRRDMARVWGLHGALGQGKSTVVDAVLARLTGGVTPLLPRVHGWHWVRWFTQRHGLRRRLNAKRLEASHLAPDRLNATLISRLVVPALLREALPMAMLTTLVSAHLVLIACSLGGWSDHLYGSIDSLLEVLLAAFGLPVVAAMGALVVAALKPEHQAGHLEWAVYRLAAWTGSTPDLVILDDLDRASLDQQRAVLRALVRHTRLLGCPLVVCFDEAELLASPPNPEEPAELLRKLIQVPLRLPPRSREDAVLLAWGAVKVWHDHNPERRAWGGCLLHPVWVAHLARVMLVTESVGPRRAKGLLAEVVTAAEALGGRGAGAGMNLDEVSALLLLAAVAQIQPLARRDPDLLLACLEAGGDAAAWQAWAAQPRAAALFKWLDARPREQAHLQALLRLSDTMLPSATGWRRLLLGRAAHAGPTAGSGVAISLEPAALKAVLAPHAGFYDALLKFGEHLDAVGWGTNGSEQLDRNIANWNAALPVGVDAPLCLFWPMMVVGTWHWPAVQRTQGCTMIDRWLAALETVNDVATAQGAKVLRRCWLREWVVDACQHAVVDPIFWNDRLRDAAAQSGDATAFVTLKARRRCLQHEPAKAQEAALSDLSWAAALALDPKQVDGYAVVAALAQGPRIPASGPQTSQAASQHLAAALRNWPVLRLGLDDGDKVVVARLREHLSALRAWLPQQAGSPQGNGSARLAAAGALERPWSLAAWLQSARAQRLALADCMRAFEPLCTPVATAAGAGFWSFGHWVYLLHHVPAAMGAPPVDQVGALRTLDGSAWRTALCLMAQGWCGKLVPKDVSDILWPALMEGARGSINAALADAALAHWADSAAFSPAAADTTGTLAAETTDDRLRFGVIWLRLDNATAWFKVLLSAADRADNSTFVAVQGCLQAFEARAVTTGQLDFCTAARDVAVPWSRPFTLRSKSP